jgi:hypothetical protein
VGTPQSGGEAEALSIFASGEGLSVAAPGDQCGDQHAAISMDGALAHCLHSPMSVGNVKDRTLGELLTTDHWRRAAGMPCPAHSALPG